MIDENRVIWNSIGANLLYKNLAFGKIILFKKWFKQRVANYKPASIGMEEAKRIFADKNEA